MLSRLFRKSSNQSARHNRIKNARRRMRLEQLEGRQLMAAYNWTLGADGDFSNPAAWTGPNNVHNVPGPADDASIPGNIIVTSSSNNSVNRVGGGQLRIAAGTFSTANNLTNSSISGLTIDPGATLQVTGGTFFVVGSEIGGTIAVSPLATFRFLRGVNDFNAGGSLTGEGLFVVTGDVFGGPTLNLETDLVAPSNFLLESGILTGPEDLIIAGEFDWLQGGAGGTTMAGTGRTIVQAGAKLNVGGGGVSLSGRTIENAGQIDFFAAGHFDIRSGATINNLASGVIDIQVDRDLSTNFGDSLGGYINNDGLIKKTGGSGSDSTGILSTLNNTGTIDVQVGNMTIFRGVQDDAVLQTAALSKLTLGGNGNFSIEFGGTTNIVGNGMVVLSSCNIATSAAGAIVNVNASTQLFWTNSQMTIPVGATFVVNGIVRLNNTNDVTLQGGGTLRTVGEFIQEGTANLRMEGDVATETVPTTIDIPVGNIYTIKSDADIIKGSAAGGAIKNRGAFRKVAGTDVSFIDAALENSNFLTSLKGTLGVRNTTSMGGKYHTATNATIRLADNGASVFEQHGTFTASGTGKITVGVGTLTADELGATFVIPPSVNFVWEDGILNIPIGAVANINGKFSTTGSGDRNIYGGGTLRINGTLTHGATNNFRLNANGVTPTTLHIPPASTFAFAANSNIYSGVLINEGSIRKIGGVGISEVRDSTLVSSGNFTADVGELHIRSSLGEMSGGSMNVSNGAIINLTGGGNVNYTGTFTGSGTGEIRLTGGYLIATGAGAGVTFDFPAGLFRWSGGAIATNGLDVTIKKQVAIVGADSVSVIGGGTLHIAGNLNHQSQGNLQLFNSSTVHITPTGTYNIQTDGDITGGADTILVEGTLRKNGGNGLSQISARVNNLGRVEARRGTLSITGTIPDVVGNDLAGGLWGAYSTATVAATLDLTENITSIGLAATVVKSGPNSSLPSIANLSTVSGSFLLLDGASFGTVGNFTNNGIITLSSTSVLNVNGNYTQNATGRLNAQMVNSSVGRIRTTGNVLLAGILNVSHTGTQPALASRLTVIENQGALQVGGTFNGLPQFAAIVVNGMTFKINYNTNTGANDTVLVRTA